MHHYGHSYGVFEKLSSQHGLGVTGSDHEWLCMMAMSMARAMDGYSLLLLQLAMAMAMESG